MGGVPGGSMRRCNFRGERRAKDTLLDIRTLVVPNRAHGSRTYGHTGVDLVLVEVRAACQRGALAVQQTEGLVQTTMENTISDENKVTQICTAREDGMHIARCLGFFHQLNLHTGTTTHRLTL